jgi:hypothetical protein
MGRGLNAQGILGVFAAVDFGVQADGQIDDAPAIQRAIAAASTVGGGIVVLPSDADAIAIGSTIRLPDRVELQIPAGCTLKLLPGKDVTLIANADETNGNAGVRITGGGTIDGNRANNTSGSWHGVSLTKVTDANIDVAVKSCRGQGVLLTGCSRVDVPAHATDNGEHGIALVDTARSTVDGRSWDNSQVVDAGIGDGVNLAGASVDNVISVVAYDSATTGKRQGYGVREAAASACDRNTLVGCSLAGNLTGTVSLVGASSKLVDNAATVATVGTPSAQAFGDGASLGASVQAAPLDHKHGMPSTVMSSQLASDVARPQLGVNNGHEIWQRGTGPFTANNAYADDRWQIILVGTDAISVTPETTVRKTNSKTSAKLAFTLGSGAGASRFKQRLVIADGYEHLLGQPFSVRCPVNANAGNAVRAFVTTDGTGGTTIFSGYHAGNSAFADLDVANVIVPADATYVEYGITLQATATVYLDNVMPVQSPVCCNYAKLHPAEELARCLRYYETLPINDSSFEASMVATAGGQALRTMYFFRALKAVIPTTTKVGTWAVGNCGQPSVQAPGLHACWLQAFSTAAGDTWFSNSLSGGAGLTMEANP